MNRLCKIIMSIPRTIWFNFHYLPIRQAIKLPIWIANNVRIAELHRGCLILNTQLRIGLIRIGYHEADGVDIYSAHTIINIAKTGKLFFKKDAHIGQGAILHINDGGNIYLGENFAISGTTTIISSKFIRFGDNVQLSWNSLIMDSDGHTIYDINGNHINHPKDIVIGDNVWIAANCIILKGTLLQDNTVMAANSLTSKEYIEGNCILAGQPACVVKKIGGFKI